MARPRGRRVSRVHTPLLIRAYLLARDPFPEDTPASLVERRGEGDYISRMHRQVKLRIRAERPHYQYPRSHSFKTLIRNRTKLGLVEPTGDREAGQLDPALGFKPRTYIRLVPGAEDRPDWQDPIGHELPARWPRFPRFPRTPRISSV